MDISKESGRVSAYKLTRFIKDKQLEETVFIPQFEYITYECGTGDLIESKFLCIEDGYNISGLAEFNTEFEALQFALEYRDNLEF
jgi:hypothetical protein